MFSNKYLRSSSIITISIFDFVSKSAVATTLWKNIQSKKKWPDAADITFLHTESLEMWFDLFNVKYVIYESFTTTSQETHPLEYVFHIVICR